MAEKKDVKDGLDLLLEMGDVEYLVSIRRCFPQEVLVINTPMISKWFAMPCTSAVACMYNVNCAINHCR